MQTLAVKNLVKIVKYIECFAKTFTLLSRLMSYRAVDVHALYVLYILSLLYVLYK